MKQRFDGKYLKIVDVKRVGRQIRVSFENGDVVWVSTKNIKMGLGGYKNIDWGAPFIDINGSYISFYAHPEDFIVSAYTIRRLTDPKLERYVVRMAKKQDRYIGKRLKALRVKRHLGLAEAARKAGLKPDALHDIEKGKRSINAHHSSIFKRILGAMNCSLADFVGGAGGAGAY